MSNTNIKTPRRNIDIASFMDSLTNRVEAYAVKNRTIQTIAESIVNYIFPRIEKVVDLMTENGGKSVNEGMRKTLFPPVHMIQKVMPR